MNMPIFGLSLLTCDGSIIPLIANGGKLSREIFPWYIAVLFQCALQNDRDE